MNQKKLSDLALLSIEKEISNSIDFNSVINDFAEVKASKIKFYFFFNYVHCTTKYCNIFKYQICKYFFFL